jgi:hypothetical protein
MSVTDGERLLRSASSTCYAAACRDTRWGCRAVRLSSEEAKPWGVVRRGSRQSPDDIARDIGDIHAMGATDLAGRDFAHVRTVAGGTRRASKSTLPHPPASGGPLPRGAIKTVITCNSP